MKNVQYAAFIKIELNKCDTDIYHKKEIRLESHFRHVRQNQKEQYQQITRIIVECVMSCLKINMIFAFCTSRKY